MTPLSYIAISKKNLLHNLSVFKEITVGKKIAAVVKANAYGHGLKEIVSILDGHVDYFQVDDIEELEKIREYTTTPVFVFGYVQYSELEKVVSLNGILGVYDRNQLERLNSIGADRKKIIEVHIKIDALLGRQGVLPEEVSTLKEYGATLPYIRVTGVYSHFANIEDTHDVTHAVHQKDIFNSVAWDGVDRHMEATSGVISKAYNEGTIVRIGIGLYGMYPSAHLRTSIPLRPVLSWHSHVAQIKTLPEGHPIGYGCTYHTTKPTIVAIIPQGYSDGFDRKFSNKGSVLINTIPCPILGRVAMNMCVVDVTHLSVVSPEMPVIILGESLSAEVLAGVSDTINYEVTTRISPLLSRIVI
jgi:alanine racemase